MNECDTIIYAHPEKSVYNFNYWLDVDLLPFVEQALDTYSKNLLILHTIGIIGITTIIILRIWYFTPDISRIITQNTKESHQLIWQYHPLYGLFFRQTYRDVGE